jgi:hypothetical protein
MLQYKASLGYYEVIVVVGQWCVMDGDGGRRKKQNKRLRSSVAEKVNRHIGQRQSFSV